MYIYEEMIDLGLKEGQTWPSDEHKHVAITIGLGNSNVTTKDKLIEIVQSVLKVPQERIKLVRYNELVAEFGCPAVFGD